MPKAYIIARLSVSDPDRFGEYVKEATAAIRKFGGRPLARGGAYEALEGEARARNVVIEFDSLEEAKRYFNSPEYQAARKKRLGAAVAEIVAVEGVE
jgi:uncharacterized protein (DUF1330 family)